MVGTNELRICESEMQKAMQLYIDRLMPSEKPRVKTVKAETSTRGAGVVIGLAEKEQEEKIDKQEKEIDKLQNLLSAYRQRRAAGGGSGRVYDAGECLRAERKIAALERTIEKEQEDKTDG